MAFEPDYIIVGAGAGGGVLASRLAEGGKHKVLLIEAGPDNSDSKWIRESSRTFFLYGIGPLFGGPLKSPSRWDFRTVPQEEKRKIYSYPRGTGVGGSVNHHAMFDGRGSPRIYDRWAEKTGDNDWSAENVYRVCKKMENYDVEGCDPDAHGKEGWLYVKKADQQTSYHKTLYSIASEKLGVPMVNDIYANPQSHSGVYPADVQIHPDGQRAYVGADFLLPTLEKTKQQGRNNFELLTDHLVTRVIFEGNRAVGVEAIEGARAYQVDAMHKKKSRSGPRRVFKAKKEVILCGGSINTPQVLMLSGVGPADHLKEMGIAVQADLPGVGSHLQDHMEINLCYHIHDIPGKIFPFQALYAGKLNPYWRRYINEKTKGSWGATAMFDCHSGLDDADPLEPDLHFHAFNVPFRDYNYDPKINKDTDPFAKIMLKHLSQFANPIKPQPFQSFLIEILKVQADTGTIRLASTDPTAPPIIDEQLAASDTDVTRLATGIELGRKIMADERLAPFKPEEQLPGPNYPGLEGAKEYVRTLSAYGHHMSGTAKMGSADDPMAVVDSNLKVRGIEGLRICDTSICPEIPGYNTSRPTYAIGEILAEKIERGL